MVKRYAQILYDLTKNKSPEEIKKNLKKFVLFLQKNRKLNQIEEIIKKFKKIYNQKNNIIDVQIFSTEKLREQEKNNISNFLKEKYSAKEIDLISKVKPELKGGIKIKINNEDVIDKSIAKQLRKLKDKITN